MSAAIREWLRRLRATFDKAPEDAEMEEELRLHVDMIADELKRRGLFGLLAYTVARPTKEIGIRMALGATRGRVSRMVATSAGWLVSVGLLLGAPTAFWSTRFAARSVENLPAGGAVPIASAAAALIAVAFIAVYVPTRRATRVEPVIALRAE